MVGSFHLMTKEVELIKQIELDRIAEISFAEIYEKLLSKKIAWSAFAEKEIYFLEPREEAFFHFPEKNPQPIHRFFSFSLKKEKIEAEKSITRIIEATVFLEHRKEKSSFTRSFLLQKAIS